MISVVTSTYNTTPQQLLRLYSSLKNQTYTEWEWVIYDDSPTENMEVFRLVQGICADERYHIYVTKPHIAAERGIGYAKRYAFGMAHSNILVEVDHDDELMPTCLEEIKLAFDDPEVGFVFSDWAEVLSSGEYARYSSG